MKLLVVDSGFLQVRLQLIPRWRCHVEVSFMFERAIIHLGAIDLLEECFSSSKKRNRPLPRILSCMHRAPYQEHTELCSCCWQSTVIAEGECLWLQSSYRHCSCVYFEFQNLLTVASSAFLWVFQCLSHHGLTEHWC